MPVPNRSQRQRSHGVGEYPPQWDGIAKRIKDEAGWRCVRCGHKHETSTSRHPCDDQCRHAADGKQRMLTVHHLDMNPANCADANLAALCQVCHLQVQHRYDPLQTSMFERERWLHEPAGTV